MLLVVNVLARDMTLAKGTCELTRLREAHPTA